MPDKGTPRVVSVFGSDETNTGRRERRRRMRARRYAYECSLGGGRDSERIIYWNRDKAERLLFVGAIVLDERLRGWGRVLPGGGATRHVRAAFAFASLIARRIGKNARRGRKLQRPGKHCQH